MLAHNRSQSRVIGWNYKPPPPAPPLSTVKYIREVSPLFKKPSLVADLPWDGVRPQSPSYSGSEDSGSPKHGGSSTSKDRKVISLKMCFISRNLTMPDLENRWAGPRLRACGTACGNGEFKNCVNFCLFFSKSKYSSVTKIIIIIIIIKINFI